MGRQLRIEYPGAIYHIMSHGNGFQWIYKNTNHLNIFINVLISVIQKYKVKIHAVVIMRNHYHILLELTETNLSKAMKKLNSDFARIYNKESERKGSVIRDRYKSILIQNDKYYFNVLRYICQNPLRKQLCSKCEEYEGSYLNWLEKGFTENLFCFDRIKEKFRNNDWKESFYNWINEEIESNPFNRTRFKNFCGSEEWIKKEILKINSNKFIGVNEEKKYYSLKIDDKLIMDNIEGLSKNEKQELLLYIYSEYSDLTAKDLIKKFDIKSENSCWKRISRIRKKIKTDVKLLNLIKEIEMKLFG